MPHVNVTVIGNAPTQEQKSALFSKISDLLVTVLGPTRKLTLVSVRTEPATNWSVGGDEAEAAGLVGVEAVIRTVAGSSVENRARMIGETTTVLRRSPKFGRIRTNSAKRRGGVPGRQLITFGAASHTFGQKRPW
jgi:4-oxalocrotonate tautomerase family enzyme